MNEVKEWLLDWFAKSTHLSVSELKAKAGQNYFDNGWIDSFAFIAFIAEVEEHFGVRFSNDDFQNRSFGTIEGLASLIVRIRENAC